MLNNRDLDRPIEVLDSKHMMSLILYISEYGPSRRTDIYENVSRNMSMPEKIDILKESGIITEVESFRGGLITLTDDGVEIARHLGEIEGRIRTKGRLSDSSVLSEP